MTRLLHPAFVGSVRRSACQRELLRRAHVPWQCPEASLTRNACAWQACASREGSQRLHTATPMRKDDAATSSYGNETQASGTPSSSTSSSSPSSEVKVSKSSDKDHEHGSRRPGNASLSYRRGRGNRYDPSSFGPFGSFADFPAFVQSFFRDPFFRDSFQRSFFDRHSLMRDWLSPFSHGRTDFNRSVSDVPATTSSPSSSNPLASSSHPFGSLWPFQDRPMDSSAESSALDHSRGMWDWDLELLNPARLNLEEQRDKFVMSIRAPGMSKQDLHVKVERNGYLHVWGEHTDTMEPEKEPARSAQGATSSKDASRLHRVRSQQQFSSFERWVALPESVNADAIVAKFENDTLTITLPKTEEAQSEHQKEVPIQ